ncbi:MAG: pilus assembly protein [Pigmentiphaga sp.]|nr:pilus assembly protein [Pigmentiphaga sp.]
MPSRRALGMAMTEFVLVALPLLLAGLAIIELARWQLARAAVGHALLEAARGGQDGWQDERRVAERFELALLPLWGAGADPRRQQATLSRLRDTAANFRQQAQAPMWQIEPLVSPPAGLAARSLIVQLIYWHRPWVPGVPTLLRQLGRLPPDSPLRAVMRRTGWLPIRQRLALEWHRLPTAGASLPGAPAQAFAPIMSAPGPGSGAAPPPPFAEQGGLFLPRCLAPDCLPSAPALPDEGVAPEDLCGTILCCPP